MGDDKEEKFFIPPSIFYEGVNIAFTNI